PCPPPLSRPRERALTSAPPERPAEMVLDVVGGTAVSSRAGGMPMLRPALFLVGLSVFLPQLAVAAYRDSNEAVSGQTQMNGGGCYPASLSGLPTEMLNFLNPEWAAIDVGAHMPPESDPVTLHGT